LTAEKEKKAKKQSSHSCSQTSHHQTCDEAGHGWTSRTARTALYTTRYMNCTAITLCIQQSRQLHSLIS